MLGGGGTTQSQVGTLVPIPSTVVSAATPISRAVRSAGVVVRSSSRAVFSGQSAFPPAAQLLPWSLAILAPLRTALRQKQRPRPTAMGSRLSAHDEGKSVHEQALGFQLERGGLKIRPLAEEDIPVAAKICADAFDTFNASVGLGPEFGFEGNVDATASILRGGLLEGHRAFVLESAEGEVCGSNCIEVADEIAAIGPITVDPSKQAAGGGRLLMQACMKAAAELGMRTVRLHQIASNARSYSLYLDLGFDPLCTLVNYEGVCTAGAPEGFRTEPLRAELVDACDALHYRLCGVHRRNGIASAISGPHPTCVVFDQKGAVAAYSTGLYLEGHTAAASEEAFQCLVVTVSAAVEEARANAAPLPPPGLLVPHAYPTLMRWLARNGFRVSRQVVQMGYGPYIHPKSFYCPGINY